MKKISALVLAVILINGLSGCSENGGILESGGSSAVQSAVESAVSDNTSDSYQNSDQIGLPEELTKYIGELDNGDFVFVDYSLNEDPAVITDKDVLGETYEKALAALKNTDEYAKFSAEFTLDSPRGMFGGSADDYFGADGSPEPKFKCAYTDDFDMNGENESFVVISIAKIMDDGERWGERDFLIYVGEDSAEAVCDYYNAKFGAVLDYGVCRQITVSSKGWNGNDSLSNIWGSQDEKAVKLYGGRLSYEKSGCFLYSSGPQNIGDFAVYDIKNGEYLAIQGRELTTEEVFALDGGNAMGCEYGNLIDRAVMLGGKYFIINGKCWIYENGELKPSDDKIRASETPGLTGEALKALSDIDYDAAISAMITPEKARELN